MVVVDCDVVALKLEEHSGSHGKKLRFQPRSHDKTWEVNILKLHCKLLCKYKLVIILRHTIQSHTVSRALISFSKCLQHISFRGLLIQSSRSLLESRQQ